MRVFSLKEQDIPHLFVPHRHDLRAFPVGAARKHTGKGEVMEFLISIQKRKNLPNTTVPEIKDYWRKEICCIIPIN